MKRAGTMKFSNDFINKILCGDCLSVMRQMPDGCVDLVITSPPYNLKNSTGNGMKDGRGGKWKNAALVNGYNHHNDNMPHEEYAKWQRECLTEMYRLSVQTALFFTIINGVCKTGCYKIGKTLFQVSLSVK
jgi:modification methylase